MNHNAPPPSASVAFVALGSNLGDSPALLRSAIEQLQLLSTRPLLISRFHRTEPLDCPPGSPPFINAVVGLHPLPGETPETLLENLLQLEKKFGRQPKVLHNEARPLDLDLITFGHERHATPFIVLPHPRARSRIFVLQPLAELAPDLVLPGEKRTVQELLADLTQSSSR